MTVEESPGFAISRQALIAGLALALLTLVTYLPALDNGFVGFDDGLYVTDTPWIDEGLTTEGATWTLRHFYASNWHPLTLLSHMLDNELFGLQPRGHHLTSVLFHLANVVLLFALLWRMTGSLWRSALVAAFFAVHPLRVESVAWVSERKDVLSMFFALLTVAVYLRWVRRRSPAVYALMLVCFSLALMAKPMVVTLPCVLLLLDIWPLRRLEPESFRWRTAISLAIEKLPLAALAFAAGVATLFAQGALITAPGAAPLGLRLANAVTSYAAYLGKTFVPLDLAIFYPFPAEIAAWKVVAASALLLVVTTWSLVIVRRAPYFTIGWLWFAGTLVPVIGLVKVGDQAMADRYTYLPSIGLALAVTWGLHELIGRRFPRTLTLVALASLAALVFLTRIQIGYWADSVRLFQHAIAVTEDNSLAHSNLAFALRQAGNRQASESHYRAALALRPDVAEAHAGLGQALLIWGEPQAALPHLQTALELDPRQVRIHHNLAMTLDELGRESEAMDHLWSILRIEPTHVKAHWGLGDLLARRGEEVGALGHYLAALAIEPGLADLRLKAATLLDRLGRLEEAVVELGTVLQQQPDSIQAHQHLGMIRERQGDLDSARRHLGSAFAAAPPSPDLALTLTWVLVRQNDFVGAETVLRQAQAVHPGEERLQRALAELLALRGRDEEGGSSQQTRH